MKWNRWMIKNRIPVIILCLLLVIPSFLGMAATRVKYDLLYYLPGELETVRGQEILTEEFGKGAFSLIVTEGMSEADEADLENEVSRIGHVDSVIGYASVLKGAIPAEILPEEISSVFRKEDARLFAVFFDETSSSEGTMEAVSQIRRLADGKCFVSGLSAIVLDTKNMVDGQKGIYIAIAVAVCLAVMMLTMDSFLIPILFLIGIGVSVMWNMGSNYFLGEISYVTMAVAAVLQLAVTMDYSIFLWNSYKEKKAQTADRDEAMALAIHETFGSVLGSSLTTVAGFISICFMSFTLGKDLGIVMSKGVLLGVLGTVTFLPCLIRAMDGAIEKTSHRCLLPDVSGIGRFVTKHYVPLCVAALVLAVPAFYGYSHAQVCYDMSGAMPAEMESVKAAKKLEANFDTATTHLLLVGSDVPQRDVVRMTGEIGEVDGVRNVIGIDSLLGAGIPESMIPEEILSKVESDRYRLMMISSEYVISSDAVNSQIDAINAILRRYDPEGMLIGEAPCTKDLIAVTDHDFSVVTVISMAAIFVIIALVLRSASLPVILVCLIELAIAVNLGIPYYTGTKMSFVSPILISTIQLGATVDYAILLTNRYRGFRSGGASKEEAVSGAVSVSARSILVSGISFFAATFGVGLYSDVDIISSLMTVIARGALLSAAVVLLLLPAALCLLDPVIIRTTAGMKAAKTLKE